MRRATNTINYSTDAAAGPGPHYYGAFVLDPDGHNIEAVCHEPYLG
jgi:hypothetical protein